MSTDTDVPTFPLGDFVSLDLEGKVLKRRGDMTLADMQQRQRVIDANRDAYTELCEMLEEAEDLLPTQEILDKAARAPCEARAAFQRLLEQLRQNCN
jgi:hypothetical protein